MDRRTFLQVSAMTATTTAACRSSAVEDTAIELQPELEWHKAPCRFCGTGCHVMVGVRDGWVVAVAGDEKAPVNKGLLCVKGYHAGMALYGTDRLTGPLLRENGRLVPISWDRAIDIVADRIANHPDRFAFYGSGQWTIPEGYACQKFMKGGLGNNHIDPNARLCMASAVTGYVSTYGVDEPAGCYEDLDKCDVLITWGNNAAEMHPVLFSRFMDRRARGEDVTLIDIATRATRTTDFADHFLQFQPQTDLAIMNCIANLLIDKDVYDKEFVQKHCNFRADTDPPSLNGRAITFEEYKQLLEPYTRTYTRKLSGVASKQLSMLADLFANRDLKIVSLWCMGFNQHTRGTAVNNLVHGLHLLTGHWGRPGDGPQSLTGQPAACGTVREVGTLAHALPGGRLVANAEHRTQSEELWNLPAGRINPEPGYHTVEMWKRFCTPTEEGGDIDTIWVQVTNPGQSLPDLHRLAEPASRLRDKFLIVSDVYPTATTELADLVLPSAMWVEKNGIYGNSERRTQQWFKMVNPPGEARDDCWQVIAVARRLFDRGIAHMRDRDGEFLFRIVDTEGRAVPAWDWKHYYDVNVDEQLFDEYRRFTRLKHKDLAPYAEYVKARGLRWPVVQQPDGTWRETRWRFAEFDDPYVSKGKGIDFYHSVTEDGKALVWFRPYEDPPEMPDDEYPFWLSTGRVLEHWHTGTMTCRVGPLNRAMPRAYVEMHPYDASELGIRDGDEVVVETRRGELRLTVWLEGRGRPAEGGLFIPFFDEKLLVNNLTLADYDPFSKQPDYKKCAARVRRV